jgi:hypothetical protein
MVLRSLTLLSLAACVQPHPAVRAAEETPAAVLVLLDQEHGDTLLPVPAALTQRVTDELAAHNLVARSAPADASLARVRDTDRRMARLIESERTPVAVLLETKALAFSALGGRYRWTVHTRMTAARVDRNRPPVSRDFDLSVFVEFEHEREAAALAVAAPAIAERLGALLDELLSD